MKKEYADRFKFSFFDIGILILISFASVAGNFQWKRLYWLAEMPVFIFVLLLSILGVVMLIFKRPGKIRWGVVDCLLIFYFLYLFFHSVTTYFPSLPSDRIWIIIATFLFYCLLRFFHTSAISCSLLHIFNRIVYLAAFHAIVGIFQCLELLLGYDKSQKIAGLFSNPGLYGCFMAVGACLCLSIILNTGDRLNKYINQFMFLLIIVGLVLSGSRTAWIAAFIPCTLIILDHFFEWKQLLRNALIPILLLLITFLVVLYLYKMNTTSISGRMLIWKIGWIMFKDQPVFGMGYGSFYTEYGNYQADYFLAGARPEEEIQIASMNYYTFSEPLNLLIEEGIIGTILFVLLIGYCIFGALKSNVNSYKNVRVSVLSIMAVLMIFGLFSYPFQDLFFNLFFILSIAIISCFESTTKQRRLLVPGRLFRMWMIVLLLIIGGYSTIKLHAFYTWKKAKEKILMSEGDALAIYDRVYRQLGNNGAFLFNYGSELAELGQYSPALDLLQRAANYGNSVELHLQLGKVYQALGQLVEAERSLLLASAMNPKLFLPLSKLMLFYKETGQFAKCREIASQIMRKPVKIPSGTIEDIKKLAQSNIK